jgi:hypothetical protein
VGWNLFDEIDRLERFGRAKDSVADFEAGQPPPAGLDGRPVKPYGVEERIDHLAARVA